jgi:hypothetical protein
MRISDDTEPVSIHLEGFHPLSLLPLELLVCVLGFLADDFRSFSNLRCTDRYMRTTIDGAHVKVSTTNVYVPTVELATGRMIRTALQRWLLFVVDETILRRTLDEYFGTLIIGDLLDICRNVERVGTPNIFLGRIGRDFQIVTHAELFRMHQLSKGYLYVHSRWIPMDGAKIGEDAVAVPIRQLRNAQIHRPVRTKLMNWIAEHDDRNVYDYIRSTEFKRHILDDLKLLYTDAMKTVYDESLLGNMRHPLSVWCPDLLNFSWYARIHCSSTCICIFLAGAPHL